MAIKEIKREWSPCQLDYVKTFLLHSEKELKDLPKCCIGSKAIVSETDNEYFCTESGWKLGSELGSSEVVILPETVVALTDAGFFITTPLSATPTDGATAKVTYNGTEYICTIARTEDDGFEMFGMGNTGDMGLPGGNADAPFIVMLVPAGQEGMYGVVEPLEEVNSVTISIVQTDGAASGGAADSPVVIAKLTNAGGTYSIDKTFDEIASLAKSGKIVYLHNVSGEIASMMPLVNYTGTATPKRLIFSALLGGNMGVVTTYTPDGVTMEMENY